MNHEQFIPYNHKLSLQPIDEILFPKVPAGREMFEEPEPDEHTEQSFQQPEEAEVEDRNSPQDQDETKRTSRGKIVPAYDGLFAKSLIWNSETLDHISEAANLRSTITITAGNNTVERTRNYMSLGETATWGVGNLFRYRKDRSHQDQEYTVNDDLSRRFVKIELHDKIIAESAKQSSERLEDAFTTRLNTVAKAALIQSVLAEKKELTRIAVMVDGICIGEASVSGVFLYSSYLFLTNTDILFQYFPPQNLFDNINLRLPFISLATGSFSFSVGTGLAAIELINGLMDEIGTKKYVDPYFESLKDLNPFRHITRGVQGALAIRSSDEIVRLKKLNNS